jgi:glycosyltransferase involved in cell wall biosynthesis
VTAAEAPLIGSGCPGAADVSVIVPTLNEERYLPTLLASLAAQTRPVREVLVIDAASSDGTVAAAERAGARVVGGGGHPGFSRNLGATLARGEWLLFLDADVRLPRAAVEGILAEADRRRLDAASCAFEPDSTSRVVRLHHRLSSDYFWLSSRLGWVHSIGAFILVRRSLHDEIGGFDARVRVAEDQDYVRRLGRAGRYAFTRKPVVEIAARRFRDEGFVKMSAKWLGIELHRLVLGEIRGDYFRYFK